jgi:glutamine amidotransferase
VALVKGRRGLTCAMQHVVIIDYGSGNLHSAAKAFERASTESNARAEIDVTSDPFKVGRADRVVLPGVGAFADCKRGLLAIPGMIEALEDAVHVRGRPFLGICVGMQLLASRGLEHEVTEGLGWIAGEVRAIEPSDPHLKIPHMGWNTLDVIRPHPLLAGIKTGRDGLHAYFVHSYHLLADDAADVVAVTDYGGPVTALVARDNIAGTQFHPEKSQALGLGLIANFLTWRP